MAASFECPLRGAAVNVQVRLHPCKHVAHLSFAAAGCQIVNLPFGELSVPDVEIRQVSDKSLCGIEPPAISVLWQGESIFNEADQEVA